MKKTALLLFLLIMSESNAHAANTGASFLLIGTSARALSMGGAYVGIANDITALNYNPSGLAGLVRGGITAQHTQWITDINHDYAAAAFPTKIGTIGASFVYLSQGSIEGRDANRNRTGSFDATDSAFTLSFSKRISDLLSGGVNVKVIREQISDYTATGAAVDLGILMPVFTRNFQVGLAVQNLGPKMKFISESYDLPTNVTAGCGYTIGGLTLACDIQQRIYDNRITFNIGTEFSPIQTLSLRGGYLTPLTSNKENNNIFETTKGLGAGLGLRLFSSQIDYTFVPYGDLGNTHRISFSLQF